MKILWLGANNGVSARKNITRSRKFIFINSSVENKIVLLYAELMKRKTISIIIIVILLMGSLFFGYTGNYYRCSDPKEALESTDDVKVEKTDFGYFFDGPGKDKCMIFYPGGLVEDIAYADILKRAAENGFDCALVHMPFNLAVFGMNRADIVREKYDYKKWYIGGHSLGGAMAGNYAASHAKNFDGVLLLAAYPTKDLSKTSLNVLSVYGSNDRVLNRSKLKSAHTLMADSFTEQAIEGGNHGHFGNYGHQKGDGRAAISNDEQMSETVSLMISVLQ